MYEPKVRATPKVQFVASMRIGIIKCNTNLSPSRKHTPCNKNTSTDNKYIRFPSRSYVVEGRNRTSNSFQGRLIIRIGKHILLVKFE